MQKGEFQVVPRGSPSERPGRLKELAAVAFPNHAIVVMVPLLATRQFVIFRCASKMLNGVSQGVERVLLQVECRAAEMGQKSELIPATLVRSSL